MNLAKMKRLIFTLLTGILMANTAIHSQNLTCRKWEVLDITYKSKSIPSNPFGANFGAIFTHQNGKTIDIPGFYNGNKDWVIRFSPAEEGRWTFTTYASDKILEGKKGTLTVSPNTKVDRHGAVVIDKNKPQRLAYEDGITYFSLAFEIDWLFALDAENPQDIPKTKQIVGHMAENGFNKAIMNVYAYNAKWGEREKIDPRFNFAEPKIFPFGGTNEKPDHESLNVDFFKHFDRVIAHLHEREIVSHLMIYVWNKAVNWPKPGSPQDDMYFEYVVKRYQAYPNIIWDISKEALAYGMNDMGYITSRIERLRKLDGHKRLVTVHDYHYCRTFPDKVDFISVQEWKPNLYNEMMTAAKTHPQKPIFNVEHGGYEKTMHSIFNGSYTDPVACLERNYECIFAGTYSTYYWQNASWYELVYDPMSLKPENRPNFHYYKILTDFFKEYDYNKLTPAQYFYSPYCLTNNKDLFIYFLPWGMSALEGSAPKEAKGKNVEIRWFNPLTGEYSEIQKRKLGDWTGIKPANLKSPISLVIMKVIE